jgi:uncharacterized protein (DUF4415 family)
MKKSKKKQFEMKKEYDFSKATRGRFYKPKKISTTIRFDDDILIYFKRLSSEEKVGYQTLVNNSLRHYINEHAEELRSKKKRKSLLGV